MRTFFCISLCLAALSLARADETQGLVIPFEQVTVSSPVLQDIIKEINVKEGDEVSKGQVLAQLMNDKERLEAQKYEKLIERAEFQYKGMETLAKEKMASREAALEKLTDLELAKIQYKLAQTMLEEKTIRSPLAGIVVKKYKEPGEAVDRVDKLFDIVNIDKVYVQVYLDPKLMDKITPGAKVPVRFPALRGGPQTDMATVAFVDPRIDAASGLFRVKLVLDNPGHDIKAGMRGQVDFTKIEQAPAAR